MDKEISLSVAETKAKLSEKIRACRELDRTFVITSHGKPCAVLMSYDAYARMREPAEPPLAIDAERRQEAYGKQREAVHDIKELFDEKKLSRKGQKKYKQRVVKRMEGD